MKDFSIEYPCCWSYKIIGEDEALLRKAIDEVLCDQKYFNGSLNDLARVRKLLQNIPLLCKDFIINEYQIYEARKHGADAILLIASLLDKSQIRRFLHIARQLNMDAICEVHAKEELKKV